MILLKELVDIHDKFLKRLKDAIGKNAKCKLSQVFLDFRESFLVYGDYCSSMTLATETLDKIVDNDSAVRNVVLVSEKRRTYTTIRATLKLLFLFFF